MKLIFVEVKYQATILFGWFPPPYCPYLVWNVESSKLAGLSGSARVLAEKWRKLLIYLAAFFFFFFFFLASASSSGSASGASSTGAGSSTLGSSLTETKANDVLGLDHVVLIDLE